MLDSIKILKNVVNVNNYGETLTLDVYEGASQLDVYIQLWQSDLKTRYIPEQGSTIKIDFLRRDTVAVTPVSQTVSKYMTTPFSQDSSIWKTTLTSAEVDKLTTAGFRVIVTEPTGGTKPVFSKMTVKRIDFVNDPIV